MPINYKNYPDNWRKEIRPAILLRANYQCEFCGVGKYKYIFRGYLGDDTEVYQDAEGIIYDANNSAILFLFDFEKTITPKGKGRVIKVVLTVAHIDHNINNNDPANLKALCQRCHLIHDKHQHMKSRRETINRKKGLIELDFTTQNIL